MHSSASVRKGTVAARGRRGSNIRRLSLDLSRRAIPVRPAPLGWAAMLVGLALWATSARAEAAVAYPVVLAAGDIADCSDGNNGPKLTARLLGSHVGTVLAIGDLTYPDGAPAEYTSCYGPSWGLKSRTRPVPGNHEYNTPGATGYFGYWARRRGRAAPAALPRPRRLAPGGAELRDGHQRHRPAGDLAEDRPRHHRQALQARLPAPATLELQGQSRRHRLPRQRLPDHVDNRSPCCSPATRTSTSGCAPKAPDGTIDNARGGRQFVVGTGSAFVDGGGAARHPKEGPRHRRLPPPRPAARSRRARLRRAAAGLAEGRLQLAVLPTTGFGFTNSGSGTCVLKG